MEIRSVLDSVFCKESMGVSKCIKIYMYKTSYCFEHCGSVGHDWVNSREIATISRADHSS